MIEEREVEILLKAKKDSRAVNVLAGLSAISLVVLIALEVFIPSHSYTITLATLCAVFMCTSLGANRWVSVSRNTLISTLEKIVNRDPSALKTVAEKKLV